MEYLIYLLLITLLFSAAEWGVHSTYSKYVRIATNSQKSGFEVVEEMRIKHNLHDLAVYKTAGVLTDHYNPKTKSIYLSEENYSSASIAGIAVAAHEMGHAIQDKEGYFFLKLRQGMGKLSIIASRLSWLFIYVGFIMWYLPVVYVGVALFAVTFIFQLITLPVELNASKRAEDYLRSTGNYSDEELKGVKKVLKAAAFTYIASTLAAAIQLLRLIGILRHSD